MKLFINRLLLSIIVGIAFLLEANAKSPKSEFNILRYMSNYNIVWDKQSVNSSESMPCSGGQIGCNVWVENGAVFLYAQQSGDFDKNGEYLKKGRFRIDLNPNPFQTGRFFRQEFKAREGCVQITGELPDKRPVVLNVWVEVDRPVVRMDVKSGQKLTMTASYESWRFRDVVVKVDSLGKRRSSMYDYYDYLPDIVKKADVMEPDRNSIIWYQNNVDRPNVFDFTLENEGLSFLKDKMWNPLEKLISGGMMKCTNLQYKGTSFGKYAEIPFQSWHFKSEKPSKDFSLEIIGQNGQFDSVNQWKEKLFAFGNDINHVKESHDTTLTWWDNFWNKTYVVINPDSDKNDIGWRVGRNYNLFRYELGGNYYGNAPTKFNGGNLTFDPVYGNEKFVYDPDFRLWGGWSYTEANQSLVYWPFLKSGDFKAMLPEFDLYRKALHNSELRTMAHFGHEGCSFPEQMQVSGFPVASHYGFKKNGIDFADRNKYIPKGELTTNSWIMYLYQGQLDEAFMILEYYRFTGKDISAYIPFIISTIKFYDQHYQIYHNLMNPLQLKDNPLDANGKLVFYPSTAGERYPGKNPAGVIAGLNAITKSLLDLPSALLSKGQREYLEGFQKRLPELPKKQVKLGGKEVTIFTGIDGDPDYGEGSLYCVYPYNLVAMEPTDSAIFKNTYLYLNGKNLWTVGLGVYSAEFGDAETAQKYAIKSLEDCSSKFRRFPTFWMSGDWVPDHNWGGRGLSNIQEMLIQTPGKEIRLLPAWPKNWDVSFKLHAPYNTTIEAVVKRGRVEYLKITPEYRIKDVIIMNK